MYYRQQFMALNLIAKPAMAQSSQNLGGLEGFGRLGLEGGGDPVVILDTILSNLLGFLTICGGIWFAITIVTAGYKFIQAQGDAQQIKEAQKQITNSFIGISIVVAAVFLLSLVGELLNVEFLDIVSQIQNLTP